MLSAAHHVEGACGPLEEAAAADGLFQRPAVRVLEQHPCLDQLALVCQEEGIQHPVHKGLPQDRGARHLCSVCGLIYPVRCRLNCLRTPLLSTKSPVTVAGTVRIGGDCMERWCQLIA